MAQLEKDKQILKNGVNLLHRKFKESQHVSDQRYSLLQEKDHEINILRQRANSNEAKARGFDAAKRRIQELQALLLRQQMQSDLTLNHRPPRDPYGGGGYGPGGHFGNDGIC